jgi:type I restriction enzyme R subunit
MRRAMANLFKTSTYPLRFVTVRNILLTGSDASCLQAMNSGRLMQGRGLMQAIALVNHVFHDKAGNLLVYYLGLADKLRHALAKYTESGGKGDPTSFTRQAFAIVLEKLGIASDLLHGSDWKKAVRPGLTTKNVCVKCY